MAEARKQAISLRLGSADIRRIKTLATRLGASDSDVVRFAVKMMLHRMLPLTDSSVRGRQLVPMLADWGVEAIRHFDLDASALEEIVNGDVEHEQRVDPDDLVLMTLVSSQESYARLSLRALIPPSKPPRDGERRDTSSANTLRRHLYDKYGISEPAAGAPPLNGIGPVEPRVARRVQG